MITSKFPKSDYQRYECEVLLKCCIKNSEPLHGCRGAFEPMIYYTSREQEWSVHGQAHPVLTAPAFRVGCVWSCREPVFLAMSWTACPRARISVQQTGLVISGVYVSRFPRTMLAIQYEITWWRHPMKTFSALLVLCAGNSPVTGEFPPQRPVTRSFNVFYDLRPKKRLSKQSKRRWFEIPSHSLWRHWN